MPSGITCPAMDQGASGAWPEAVAGSIEVEGVCPLGTIGSLVRDCRVSGTWTGIVGSCIGAMATILECSILTYCLLVLRCSSSMLDNADWPETSAGSAAAGTCRAGYAGSPSRTCSVDGQWGSVTHACTRTRTSPLCDYTHRKRRSFVPRHRGWQRAVAALDVALTDCVGNL